MYNVITGWAVAAIIFKLAATLFVLWCIYRFVKAHEKIAASVRGIEQEVKGEEPSKADRYNFGKR